MFRIVLAFFCALVLNIPFTAFAEDISYPTGPVLLTVSGEISVVNQPDTALFDLAMLQSLPSRTITTTTIWTDGIQVFEGFPLQALVEKLGIEGGILRMVAKNDYAIEFPVHEIEPEAPVIAYFRNGSEMSVRDKGPLWLVYPYDSSLDYQTEVVFNRSIWQLDRIIVLYE
ncbi:MAG: oxidoreductase [Paracoccaceae bacterium]|nr:oxidoreductase [Paracoccaceae bacterium]